MAKTRRRVSRNKTRKALKVKRGGMDMEDHFDEVLESYVADGRKVADKSKVVSVFNKLNPDSKEEILGELGIKTINGVSKASNAKVYGYIRKK